MRFGEWIVTLVFNMVEKTRNPYLVLSVSFFPGVGHVLVGKAQRGLMFIFFIIILGWVSLRIMPTELIRP